MRTRRQASTSEGIKLRAIKILSDDNKGKAWVNMELMTFWLLIQLATIFMIIFLSFCPFCHTCDFISAFFPFITFFMDIENEWVRTDGEQTDLLSIHVLKTIWGYIYPNPIKYCLSGRIIKVLDWFWCKKNFEFWKGKKTANLASFTEPWNRKNWMNGILCQKVKNTKN